MSTTQTDLETEGTELVPRWGVWPTGIAVTIGIFVASVLLWYALVDPKVSPLHLYPQPFTAVLFWVLMVFIISAFNFQLWPFTKLPQPWSGIAQVIVHSILGLAIVALMGYGWGSINPTFSVIVAGSAGWVPVGLIVLLGFFFWSSMGAMWDHWPWTDAGLSVPLAGTAEFFLGFTLTTMGFVVLVSPNFVPPSIPHSIPLPLTTTIGWFYQLILIEVVAVQLWDSWPWAQWKSRALRAFGGYATVFVLGTLWYFIARAFLSVLVPGPIQSLKTFSMEAEPAQFGVCIVVWALLWGLVFNRWPTHLAPALNRVVRSAIVFVLAVASYFVYYHWLATAVLHEPAMQGSYGGNALIGMDWVALILFWYVVSFGLYGALRKVRTGARHAHAHPALEPSEETE